jgi:hypothetical protein
MKIAYADPPYPGSAKRHYGSQEVSHQILVQGLIDNFDGWALSTGSKDLWAILPLCPEKVRVCAWTKPYNSMHSNTAPIYAWEPLIVMPARTGRRSPFFIKDYIESKPPIFDRGMKCSSSLHGQKPKDFYFWMFKMLGATPADEYTDLFPGTGNGDRYWKEFRAQKSILGFEKGAL